jgi:hypothetical protein
LPPINKASPTPGRRSPADPQVTGRPRFRVRTVKKKPASPPKEGSPTIREKLNAAYEQMKKTNGPCR